MTDIPNTTSKSSYDEGDHYQVLNWDEVPDPVEEGPEDAEVEFLKANFAQFVISHHRFRGDRTVVIKREGLLAIVERLNNERNFQVLLDLTAVDYLHYGKLPRFEVVYNFLNINDKLRLRLKVPLEENDLWIDTLTGFYQSANWFEREVMEFFGITFKGHPDPRKLFLYDEFKGHPLRKDYPYNKRQPLIGYRDVEIDKHHYPGDRGSGY